MNPADFDFLDFGCSDGANIRYVQSIDPSLKGLGIDIDPKKLEKARAAGLSAINLDILQLPREKLVGFVTMSHFLEHLPSVKVAESMVRRGIDVSRDFVLIRQPWFDSDGYLFLHDLKFYWSDWRGHPNRMVSLDFYLIIRRALRDGVIRGFEIYGRAPVRTSADSALIPLSAPVDQHHYEHALHGEKNEQLSLTVQTFREIVVVINVSGSDAHRRFLASLGALTPIKHSEPESGITLQVTRRQSVVLASALSDPLPLAGRGMAAQAPDWAQAK